MATGTTETTETTPDPDSTTGLGPGSGGTSSGAGTGSSSGESTGVLSECDDGRLNSLETDVDCGGPDCPACPGGSACIQDTDCRSSVCGDRPGECVDPVVWLDASDPSLLYTEDDCRSAVVNDGDPVRCWRNRGTSGVPFVSEDDPASYDAQGAVHLDDNVLAAEVFDGNVDDVAVFAVFTEVGGTNSFDFNLNHPNTSNVTRYSAHLPWNGTRNLVWDPGNTMGARVQTGPDLVAVGEIHIYGLINSAASDRREIILDGLMVDGEDGASDAPASGVSLGDRANILAHEFRIYEPAPDLEAREVIEGALACRWGLRDQLPQGHRYYDADGDEPAGCP
ncbi:MAG: hypothetical protein AAGF11_52800 [Myxococcota bacterium]